MRTLAELETVLSEPSAALVEDMRRLTGDLLILGAGGKMGPSLARLAKRAIVAAGVQKRVIAVARFTQPSVRESLERAGVETIAADVMVEDELQSLPDCPNILYMVGHKFGTVGQEPLAWAVNTYLAGRVAEKWRQSRIVVFSTGNVYPLVAVGSGGATEETPTGPVGDYAQSCLGRERLFTHFSQRYQTPVLIYRLNYAIDMRYGVLLEIARAVFEKRPVTLTMGQVNVIWQGDANTMALRALHHCATPPRLLNVTGPETLSVRLLAEEFGRRFGREPIFAASESGTALLNNAGQAHGLFGYPSVPVSQMLDWTAEWLAGGGDTYGKPTHFEEREGRF